MAAPLEYQVTLEDGRCLYDEASVATVLEGAQAYVVGAASKYALDGSAAANSASLIHFSRDSAPSLPQLLNGSTLLSSLVAGSREVQDARVRFGRGLTASVVETIKRTYYRASFIPSQVQADSFTELFKSAALRLAGSATASTDATAFIWEWGNAIYDRAVMGAELYRALYTEAGTADMTLQRAKARQLMGDMAALITSQDPSTSTTEVITENGRKVRFEVSKTFNIGGLEGGACHIGDSLNPQVRGSPGGGGGGGGGVRWWRPRAWGGVGLAVLTR